MKKFTTLAMALCSVLIASAGAPKQVTVVMPEKVDPSVKEVKTAISPSSTLLNAEKAVKADNMLAKYLKENISSRAEGEESGEEGDNTPGITPMYVNPWGSFYPIAHYVVNNKRYYEPRDLILFPAAKPVTFLNYSYIYDPAKGLSFPQEFDSKWEYYTGAYGDYYQYYYLSNETDLEVALTPHPVLNNPIYSTELTVGGATYYPSYLDGEQESEMGFAPGGNGAFNPGFESYLKENGYSDFEYASMLANYNAGELGRISNTVGGGTGTTAYGPTNGSAAEIRDMFFKEDLDAYGITDAEFYALGQQFTTGPQQAVLSKLSLQAFIVAEEGQEINITLYKLVPTDGGSTLQQVYDGIYTFESAPYGWTYVTLEFFDEENENEYILLDADSDYMVMISGIDDLDSFVPTMVEFENTKGEFTQDYFMRYGVYSIYMSDGAMIPLDADFNWNVSGNPNAFTFDPAMAIELTISYPYIVPMVQFQSSTEGIYLKNTDTETTLDLFDLELSDNQKATVGCVYIFSDASSEDLLANAEYSSEALKELVELYIADGAGVAGNGFTFSSARRNVQINVLGSIPAGSWIKLHNYTETFTINLPVYEFSGIGNVASDGNAVAEEYFDLQGRKLAGEANGVVIKKMTMADGSVKAVKVVK